MLPERAVPLFLLIGDRTPECMEPRVLCDVARDRLLLGFEEDFGLLSSGLESRCVLGRGRSSPVAENEGGLRLPLRDFLGLGGDPEWMLP